MTPFKYLLLLLVLFLNYSPVSLEQIVEVSLNVHGARRTEGRATLQYVKNGENIKYQMAFSEILDTDTHRSKISIGYVSYPPTVYYYRDGGMLTVDQVGNCVNLQPVGHKFVPELDWFIRLSYTKDELSNWLLARDRHQIGPTGVSILMARNTEFDHKELHRNIECKVTSATFDRTMAKNVLLEVLTPSLTMFDTAHMGMFTIRETVKDIIMSDSKDKISTVLTLDYFYSEEIDKNNLHHLERLETDLNLPFGAGCSEHIAPTYPQASESQSFIMFYTHNALQSVVSLAYDHKSNYLRKEILGDSVGVWDLNEDLFYHVDSGSTGKLANDVDIDVSLDICSVISVGSGAADDNWQQTNPNEPSILRPYKQGASSLEVLEFLGAKAISYLGQATVRDLPCYVYEAIVSEPPRLFNLDLRVDLSLNPDLFDYIVQFYVFKTGQSKSAQPKRIREQSDDQPGAADSPPSPSIVPSIGDQFWPARINLIRHSKKTGQRQLYDSLEISDFHWGLFGSSKKPSELFMMPECFSDEDEQLSINLALEFGDQLASADKQQLLRHNKYKLEKDLLDDLFRSFQMSLLHLTEFELALRPHNVLASLVISDRIEDKQLTYFGLGELPKPDSYLNNRINLFDWERTDHGGESSCLLHAIHISQVSVVIYCPRNGQQEPTCMAIFGESQPVVKRPTPKSSSAEQQQNPFSESTACRTYRLEPREPPKSSTGDLNKIKTALTRHKFKFQLTSDSQQTKPTVALTLTGTIQDFDISHQLQIIAINNYKFALEVAKDDTTADNKQPIAQVGSVRAFNTVKYDNLGDCIKMCNLDSSCKSFSYCSDDKSPEGKCILASLDIRANNIEQQLVTTRVSQGEPIVVRDLEAKDSQASLYKLELSSMCNIYERNSLSMFTETDELVRIQASLASLYLATSSAAECARWTRSLEESTSEHHSFMFAYCPTSNTCLIDENLFVSIESSSSASAGQPDEDEPIDGSDELLCQVYRKRYQNYFHISPYVIKRDPPQEGGANASPDTTRPIKQTDLQFSTVEECARACWVSLGHACISFDYCLPQNCIVNLIDSSAAGASSSVSDIAAKLDYEPRMGCLHYERDLKLDELRRANLIGHHKVLDAQLFDDQDANRTTFVGFVLSALYYLATAVLFVAGLAIGHMFNERLEMGPLLPSQSRGFGRGEDGGSKRANFGMSSSWLPSWKSTRRSSTDSRSKFNVDGEMYEDTGAIQLDDLGQRSDAEADAAFDELTTRKQTRDGADPSPPPSLSSSSVNQSVDITSNYYEEAPAGSSPNRIDVPNILL